jgi:hypothetical protein
MSVLAARITGVDESGRIATYVKHDVRHQTELFAVLRVEDAGNVMLVGTSVAQDRCSAGQSDALPLTNHLLVFAIADQDSLVMDAGPVEQLPVSEHG